MKKIVEAVYLISKILDRDIAALPRLLCLILEYWTRLSWPNGLGVELEEWHSVSLVGKLLVSPSFRDLMTVDGDKQCLFDSARCSVREGPLGHTIGTGSSLANPWDMMS